MPQQPKGRSEYVRSYVCTPPTSDAMKQYIYTVYNDKIHRAEVEKVTDQQIFIKRVAAFGYARIMPKDTAKWTPEEALDSWRKRTMNEIEYIEVRLKKLRISINTAIPNAWEGE